MRCVIRFLPHIDNSPRVTMGTRCTLYMYSVHPLSLTHAQHCTLPPSPSLSLTHSHHVLLPPSFSPSLSLTHSHHCTLPLSLSLTHTHTHSTVHPLSLTHSHHVRSLPLSLPPSLPLSLCFYGLPGTVSTAPARACGARRRARTN
jgi:hypothetical protein